MSFDALVNQPKLLVNFPGWQRSGHEMNSLWFDAPLEIGGIVEPSFTLHGEARLDMPDRNVGLELVYRYPNSSRRFALVRLDWLSWKGGHTNPRRRNWPLRGKRVGATHAHPFELNFLPHKRAMRPGDLPIAVEIDGELQTFEQARAFAGFLLGISNIELVSRPPWV